MSAFFCSGYLGLPDRPHRANSSEEVASFLRESLDNPGVLMELQQFLSEVARTRHNLNNLLTSVLASRFWPWLLLAGDHASAGDTLAALAALDSADARATSPAYLDTTRQVRLALASSSNSN